MPMGIAEQQSNKKARVELGSGQVKQEVEEEEATGGGAVVAVEAAVPRVELSVRVDMDNLHCPVCTLPMKPPIFRFQVSLASTDRCVQCEACEDGHWACSACHDKLPKNQCYVCGHAGAYRRDTTMEKVVGWHRVLCPYDVYGCRTWVTYNTAGDHQRDCPCAPCRCSEPCCAFVGSPPMLLDHLAAAPHSWPVEQIRYGRPYHYRLLDSEPRRLLVAEEDGRVFLLAALALRGLSLACVRANAEAGPQYTCRLWATGNAAAATGKVQSAMVEMEVPSTAVPGEDAAAEEEAPLVVQRGMLHGAPKEMQLSVKIDKA